MGLGASIELKLAAQPKFASALNHVVEHNLVDMDPWIIFTSDVQIHARSDSVNGRYPRRVVLCFAERRDTDDVACVVLDGDANSAAGEILTVHDFAAPGWEVDATFPDFWGWFRTATEDMIAVFHHWKVS